MRNEFLPPGAEEVPLPEEYLPTDPESVEREREALRRIHSNLVDAIREEERIVALSVSAGNAAQTASDGPTHSIDFRSVNWFGTPYTFSENQAACVKILWEHWAQRTPDVGGKTLLSEVESDAERIDLVFRNHPAWNTMIVKGRNRGTRRLQEPARAKSDT